MLGMERVAQSATGCQSLQVAGTGVEVREDIHKDGLVRIASSADDGAPSEPVVPHSKAAEDAVTPTANMQPTTIKTTSVMKLIQTQPAQAYLQNLQNMTNTSAPKSGAKRRVVKRDPNRPAPKPWLAEEVARFQQIVARDGVGSWEQKAVLLGSGRSAKALHTRWLRDQGRIIDRARSSAHTSKCGTPPGTTASSIIGGAMAPTLNAKSSNDVIPVNTTAKRLAVVSSGSSSSIGGAGVLSAGGKAKRRRVVKRDPNQPAPKAWTPEELARFKAIIRRDGPGSWQAKSVELGSGRSAKALHTRWLREQGRIVDRPRGGYAAAQQHAMEAMLLLAAS